MKLIPQSSINGCAISCLAMLSHRSYWATFRKIKQGAISTIAEGLSVVQIRHAIPRLGLVLIKSEFIPTDKRKTFYLINKISKLKYSAFLCLDYGLHIEGQDYFHCAVWDHKQKKFLDPGGDFIKGDLKFLNRIIQVK